MQGHFDLQMLHTPGLTAELLASVRKEGGDPAVEEYLHRFQQDGEWHTDNLVVQSVPSFFFNRCMSALTVYGYDYGATGYAGLAFVQLATTSSEPSYIGDVYTANIANNNLPDTPAGITADTAWKRFINDCIVAPDIKSDAGGRESIYGKFKWLYLPGECTSDQIRSVVVYGSSACNVPLSAYSKTRTARMRIKDSGSNPVTLNKLATKSLLIEYTFTMPSL